METTDVTDRARKLGFTVPVELSELAWETCVAWTLADSRRQVAQEEWRRLHTLLWSTACAILQRGNAQAVEFDHFRVPRDGEARSPSRTTLMATLTLVPRRVIVHLPEEAPPLVERVA